MPTEQLKQFIMEVLVDSVPTASLSCPDDSTLAAEAVTRTYGNKTYRASSGSVSAIKKSGDSAKKAVGAGKFDWAENPYAAAQAAHVVATGEPTVKKGSKKKTESDKHELAKCEACGSKYEDAQHHECEY